MFRPTVRLRLTLLYTGLFLLVGAVLLTVNYFLVKRSITVEPAVLRERIELRLGHSLFTFQAPPLSEYKQLERLLKAAASDLRAEALHALIIESALAFVGMAVVSLGLGWLLAGRALRPLKRITSTAKRLSEETLHERIDLQGPKDELKELADTFDEMLARLDAAFDSQRRFVANASHELRTPLSIIRAELDVTMSNPDPTLEEHMSMARVVRQAGERSERLIESLLTLARSESATLNDTRLDLGALARRVIESLDADAAAAGIEMRSDLHTAEVSGDEVLLERLIENLVENAIRYNRPGGWVRVSTGGSGGSARLEVVNSGDAIGPDDLDSLFEPFRRLNGERVRSGGGVGLGLAIVRAVAQAHDGTVEASGPAEGGLEVVVDLPTTSRLSSRPVLS